MARKTIQELKREIAAQKKRVDGLKKKQQTLTERQKLEIQLKKLKGYQYKKNLQKAKRVSRTVLKKSGKSLKEASIITKRGLGVAWTSYNKYLDPRSKEYRERMRRSRK